MDQIAIKYFEENKGKMTEQEMVRHLRKERVDEKTIESARESVFGRAVSGPPPAEHGSFWNFYDKKTYSGAAQKWADFFLGIFGLSLPLYFFVYVDHFIGFIIAWALYIFQLYCIPYFWRRRLFISFGCIIAAVFASVILFAAFLSLFI